jgi:putative multiple sugar transport system substrate-binding protein
MASNDSTAQGVTNALVGAGYTKANFPLLTGQDCDKASVKNMLMGLQSMSIFKDTRTLAAKVVEMVNAIAKGTAVSVNDTKTYNNGVKVVPSFLCDPVFATLDNYKALLIDSGYYKESDIAVK